MVRVGTDVEAALAVWGAVQRAASQPPGSARTARVRAELRAPTSLLLVAGDPVIGMLLVALVGRRLELTMLCVHPDHQRTGVGRALMAAAVGRYPTIAAWSSEPALCEALGLVRTGVTREDGSVELGAAPTSRDADAPR